jgi:hypothetical protein
VGKSGKFRGKIWKVSWENFEKKLLPNDWDIHKLGKPFRQELCNPYCIISKVRSYGTTAG